jgi:teichuronic acid exporter
VSVAEQARPTRAIAGSDPLPGSGRRALAGAAGWSAGSSALAQLLSLLGRVVVARYLVPDQYGVAAMALVVVQFAAVFSTFGLTPAVIAGRIAEPVALRSAHWLVTAVGLSLTLCIVAMAPWVGRFFAEPRVAPVLAVAGLAPLLHSAGVIPAALMQNAGRFDLLARIRVGTQICATVLAIGMAVAGYGVWALVVPTLAASLSQSALIALRAPLRFSLVFDLASLRGHLREGAHVTGSALGDYSFHSADKLIVGRMLGTHSSASTTSPT